MPARLLDAAEGLLSMGLSDDWTFEQAVHEVNSVPVVAFDHSVDAKFWVRRFLGGAYHGLRERDPAKFRGVWRFRQYRRFFNSDARRHVRRAIGRREHGFVDLAEALDIARMANGVLLKIDIEGAEYRILDQIVAHRRRFCGVVMELHDIDLHEARIEQFLRAMAGDFLLVHFHANNCTTYGPADMSIVVEICLMNRALLSDAEELVEHPLPIAGLDAKNLPNQPDIVVRFS